jgi:hypothetical protein
LDLTELESSDEEEIQIQILISSPETAQEDQKQKHGMVTRGKALGDEERSLDS